MSIDLNVNHAFSEWKSSTGRQKEWSLQALVMQLEKLASSICLKRVPGNVDELVATITWKAVHNLEKFEEGSKFSTWFYRIVSNECNRTLKKLKERCEVSLEGEVPAKATDFALKIDLIALLDKLKGDDYLLTRLVAEGYDFKTIADELGTSPETARKRWFRLREKLRDAL